MSGHVRIIAGKWRGRRLPVLTGPGIRPTGDRIRETLFNWLQMDISGARCLDLFAGSGALGLEALSRGAAHCTFVDNDKRVAAQLKANATCLNIAVNQARVLSASFPKQLPSFEKPFDIIFLDPPFNKNLLVECYAYLHSKHLVAPNGVIYVECERRHGDPFTILPEGWFVHKQKSTGDVTYGLIKLSPEVAAACSAPASR